MTEYQTVAQLVAELLECDQSLPCFVSYYDTLQERSYLGEILDVDQSPTDFIDDPKNGLTIKFHGDDRPATGKAIILG